MGLINYALNAPDSHGRFNKTRARRRRTKGSREGAAASSVGYLGRIDRRAQLGHPKKCTKEGGGGNNGFSDDFSNFE